MYGYINVRCEERAGKNRVSKMASQRIIGIAKEVHEELKRRSIITGVNMSEQVKRLVFPPNQQKGARA
jgi:hypothetical protein